MVYNSPVSLNLCCNSKWIYSWKNSTLPFYSQRSPMLTPEIYHPLEITSIFITPHLPFYRHSSLGKYEWKCDSTPLCTPGQILLNFPASKRRFFLYQCQPDYIRHTVLLFWSSIQFSPITVLLTTGFYCYFSLI